MLGQSTPPDPVAGPTGAPTRPLRARVVSALLWAGGSRLASQALSWAVTLVVIRLLSPADYGLLAMAGVFVNFLVLLAEAGLGTAVIQASHLDQTRLQRVFGAVIVIDLVLFVLLVAAAPAVAAFFDEPRLTALIRVLALQFPMMMLTAIPSALLSKELEFKDQSLVDLGSAVIGGLVVLGMAIGGYGVWALVGGSVLSQLVRTIGINMVAPFRGRPIFSLEGIRTTLGFGAQVTGARVLWFVYSQADVFIAGRLLGKDMLGAYSVAMNLASLPVRKIASIMNQVTLPAFAQAQHRPEAVSRYLLQTTSLLSLVAFPVLWGISSIAPELVSVVLGAQWHAATTPLQLLPLIMPLSMLSPFFNAAFQGIGHAGVVFKNVLTATVVMVAAYLVGVRWGLTGLSLAWVIGFPLAFLLNLRRMLPLVGLTFAAFWRAVAPSMLSAAVMLGVITQARALLTGTLQPLFLMLALIALGGISYAAMTLAFNRGAIASLRVLRAGS